MQQYFWRRIAPDAAADGIDVETEKPTYDWLEAHDYRTFVAALRRHHDLAFDDFWSEHIVPDAAAWGYDWGTSDPDTIDALEHFLDRRSSRYGLSESSVDTLRYRLNGYVRAFKLANDHARLLASVGRDSDTPAYQAVDDLFVLGVHWASDHPHPSDGIVRGQETEFQIVGLALGSEFLEGIADDRLVVRMIEVKPFRECGLVLRWKTVDATDLVGPPERFRAEVVLPAAEVGGFLRLLEELCGPRQLLFARAPGRDIPNDPLDEFLTVDIYRRDAHLDGTVRSVSAPDV
jgi:hypothetical protein